MLDFNDAPSNIHRKAPVPVSAADLASEKADIRAALSAPQEGVAHAVYPGTCRGRAMESRKPGDALRLDLARVAESHGIARLTWGDEVVALRAALPILA